MQLREILFYTIFYFYHSKKEQLLAMGMAFEKLLFFLIDQAENNSALMKLIENRACHEHILKLKRMSNPHDLPLWLALLHQPQAQQVFCHHTCWQQASL